VAKVALTGQGFTAIGARARGDNALATGLGGLGGDSGEDQAAEIVRRLALPIGDDTTVGVGFVSVVGWPPVPASGGDRLWLIGVEEVDVAEPV